MAESEASATLFTNKLYDKLKFLALVLLPAFGALYFGLGQIWGLPKVEQVIGSVAVLETFLGTVLRLSTKKYYQNGANFDGTMHVLETAEKTTFSMELNSDPEDLPGKHSVEFNIKKNAMQS